MLQLYHVNPGAVLQAFEGVHVTDPAGAESPAQAVRGADCYALEEGGRRVHYAVKWTPATCWVSAAVGQGGGWVAQALPVIEAQARECGRRRVGFQTARRGLVRLAQRCGYRVTSHLAGGWVLHKDIQ